MTERNTEMIRPHLAAKDRYYAMRERYEHADRVKKVAYSAMVQAEKELVESMVDSGVSSFALEDGSKVHISRHVSVAVNKDNQDDVARFLRKQGEDPETYSKQSFDKFQVEALVKQLLADGRLTELDVPEELNFKKRMSINVTGWKKRFRINE